MPFPLVHNQKTAPISVAQPPSVRIMPTRTWTMSPAASLFPPANRAVPVVRAAGVIGQMRAMFTRQWNGLGGLVTVVLPPVETGSSIPRDVTGLTGDRRGRTYFQRGR